MEEHVQPGVELWSSPSNEEERSSPEAKATTTKAFRLSRSTTPAADFVSLSLSSKGVPTPGAGHATTAWLVGPPEIANQRHLTIVGVEAFRVVHDRTSLETKKATRPTEA